MANQTDAPFRVLDNQAQISVIKQRIRDLETAKLQLELRINAPAPQDVISQQDRDNLDQTNTSLDYLYERLSALGGTTG